ncbi:hypothetical protein RFM41_24550 [Mesorhizobium sp. VK25A]|uniref:Uncharacterized protein n=1 Tax=Mesorhizobium vachelliae TaxID=3072309 RepID=A0ABU5ACT1_9HYPH|nr:MULTISPECIES: hypothetical protein [unclassified Mesorhizobium]MDX8534298.1 hypothetical protein [Mesorhizobium sp. VK25D]MDX8546940.1 hypothetical protein [Mesorhizobium sp. VK25A]
MVHIIPLFADQRRPDPGNAAPAEAAAPPLDPYWQEVADHYARRMARQQAFDTEIAARRLEGEIASAEADVAANAPADGEGLHHAMYGEVDPHTGRVVLKGRFDTLFDNFLKQAPPELRAGLASRKPALREAGSVRMAMQQNQRRAQYEQDHLAAAQAEELDTIAKSDPDDTATFDASRHAGLDLIAKMNLDPGSRQQAEAVWRESTARTRMEALIARDPGRATEMLSPGPAAGDRQAGDPAVDPNADLSPDGIRQLLRQARAATVTRLIDARANIDLASQNAPDAIANTGSYSGTMPSPADFAAVYGVEEGGKQYQAFGRKIDAGRQAFGMRTMPNQAIHAAMRDVEPGPGSSKEDHLRYQVTAAAALKTLRERWVDPAGYVRDVFPDVEAAWGAVTDQAGKPGIDDRESYKRAIALSVAAQRVLGVEDPRPLPRAIVQRIADGFSNESIPQADIDTAVSDFLAAAPDPGTREALSLQLDQAGLNQPADIDRITTAATGEQSPSSAAPGEPKSAVRQAAEDFGNYLSEGFESLARAPHDIGLALRDLHDSTWDFLEQLPVTPGSGAVADGRLASEAVGEAVARGLAIVRDGTAKFARPLEKFATSGSRAKSGLAADAAVARQAVETKSLVKAAEDAASRVPTGAKLEKAEVLQIIKSIARDPSKVKYQGASLGRAASKNYRKTFLDANPNLEGEVVVHHAAERQIWNRFPSIVAADEEHSLQNLRGIPKGLDNLLHKVIFRYEWDQFYTSHPQPTRQQVLDYVSYIDKKYGHLFKPPIGE